MRIAILTTQCPFVIGGAELHARNLEQKLQEAGHEAAIVTIPFKWYPGTTVLNHMEAAKLLDVSEFNGVPIDLAICLKFPAYLIRHPRKTFWILHQHRPAYDLWDRPHSDLADDANGRLVRDAIHHADNFELGQAWRVFANSNNVAKRLMHYNNIPSEPLYHPPPLASALREGEFGDYFYYPSRISESKRQSFVLNSLKHTKLPCRVIFSGAPDNPDYGKKLKELAHDLNLADRVEWKGFVSDAEMVNLYAGARGILFTPIDEDLGYVALEAMIAGKPLITLLDSGEPANLVRNGDEGFVVDPDCERFAEAMDQLMSSSPLARTMGRAALARYQNLNISWENAVAKLTGVEATGSQMLKRSITSPREASSETVPADEDGHHSEQWDDPSNVNEYKTLSLFDINEIFNFEDHLTRHRRYYETHWRRYIETIDIVRATGIAPKRVLEIGTSPPYVFTALFRQSFPDAQFKVIQEGPTGNSNNMVIKGKSGAANNIEIEVFGANVETTSLPFENGEFDLVLAMEILEHFVIDPGFVFREARRVLRTGGLFVVTTPNLISLQAVSRALEGYTPYSFGIYVPWNGVYGRHNREYAPREVERLGRYAGFETVILETRNIYMQNKVPSSVLDFMQKNKFPLGLREQNIFYIGRNPVEPECDRFPEELFPIDPAVFSAELELIKKDATGDQFAIKAFNAGPLPWASEGPARIRFTVDVIEQDGRIAFDALSSDLPHDVEPGGSAEVLVRVVESVSGAGRSYEICLYAEGAGSFKGAGRVQAIRLFADRIEWLQQDRSVL